MGSNKRLTDNQERFVQELIKGKKQREAYKIAYPASLKWKDNSVDNKASLLLKNVKVMQRYDELKSRLIKESEDECIVTTKDVLKHWYSIATADPNEIIHLRRVCCGHCFGINHEYQWRDEKEYNQSVQSATKIATEQDKEPIIPSNIGGYGFDRTIRPHPKCPICMGEGHAETHIEDTRHLSKKAKLLYAGVKQTSTGIEIKFRDQDKAMENIARHLGMFVEKHEITGKDGGPIKQEIDLSKLSIEELKLLEKAARKE